MTEGLNPDADRGNPGDSLLGTMLGEMATVGDIRRLLEAARQVLIALGWEAGRHGWLQPPNPYPSNQPYATLRELNRAADILRRVEHAYLKADATDRVEVSTARLEALSTLALLENDPLFHLFEKSRRLGDKVSELGSRLEDAEAQISRLSDVKFRGSVAIFLFGFFHLLILEQAGEGTGDALFIWGTILAAWILVWGRSP